jgi:hypothetical protein
MLSASFESLRGILWCGVMLALGNLCFAAEQPKVGMLEPRLIELKGVPVSKAVKGKKAIYQWADMQVTMLDGKIAAIQSREKSENVSSNSVSTPSKAQTPSTSNGEAGAKKVEGKQSRANARNAPVVGIVDPEAGSIGKVGAETLRVEGEIAEASTDGILLRQWTNLTLNRFGNQHGENVMNQPLWIAGAASNLVEGDSFSGVVYFGGRRRVADSLVYQYAVSPELAMKLQKSEGSAGALGQDASVAR